MWNTTANKTNLPPSPNQPLSRTEDFTQFIPIDKWQSWPMNIQLEKKEERIIEIHLLYWTQSQQLEVIVKSQFLPIRSCANNLIQQLA